MRSAGPEGHTSASHRGRAGRWVRSPGHGGGRWTALIALCVLPGVVGAAVALAVGPAGALELAPQANAVAPLGELADLRGLAVLPVSWAVLVGVARAVLLARGALTGLTVAAAWPPTSPPPSLRRLVGRGVGASALAAVLLVPCVAVLYGMAVVPVSWLFLAAVPAAVMVAILADPVVVRRGWWRRPVPWRAAGWVLIDVVVVSVAAAVVTLDPVVAAVPVAAASGVLHAVAWRAVVRAVAAQPARRVPIPMVPLGTAALVGVVALGSTLGFHQAAAAAAAAARPSPASVPPTVSSSPNGGRGLLLVSGYGSVWDGRPEHPVPGRFVEEPFSYRGLRDGRPLPYGAAQTVAPLRRLTSLLAGQIRALARRTGGPVDVVAESEGALVTEDLLRRDRDLPVHAVVLASPLVDPDRVHYPPHGTRGAGVAPRVALELLAAAFQRTAPIDLSPTSAFLASLDTTPARRLLLCPVAGLRQVALVPLADAVADGPPATTPGIPSVVVPAFHGGLLASPSTDRLVARLLRRALPGDRLLGVAERVVRALASAWSVPTPAGPTCP